MKKIYKIILSVFMILIVAGTVINAVTAGSSGNDVKTGKENVIPPVRYTSMCCIQDTYWVNWYTSEYWFQMPVSVTVWNANLNPVKNVKVQVKIYDNNGVLKFDKSKNTGKDGIAKFGYNTPRDTILQDSDNNRVEVWIDDGNGYSTYMEKIFSIKAD